MQRSLEWLAEHRLLARRHLLGWGAAGLIALRQLPLLADPAPGDDRFQQALDELAPWLTRPDDFQDVSRGKPLPHSLDDAKRAAVGLTRDTWQLEVLSDPEQPARVRDTRSKAAGTAITFTDLMQLAQRHAVRFPKLMTCLNIGCPLGNGIWEGVPLREVVKLTQPRGDLRRVHYYGFHNDDPQQMFRSSLPVGRVLEDFFGLPPVILCYKLNGQWLTPERGGPVRVVVPEAYGFKSIKWLTHVMLSNRWQANDTYGEQNNDVDSPLKTFCEALHYPSELAPGEPWAVSGYAQVGVSGLRGVEVWLQRDDQPAEAQGPDFAAAPWKEAQILAPPTRWGGGLPNDKIPPDTIGFDQHGAPQTWPLPLAKAHWAARMPGLQPGEYTLRCRTVDGQGHAQPQPRPLRKSGRAAIQEVPIRVRSA